MVHWFKLCIFRFLALARHAFTQLIMVLLRRKSLGLFSLGLSFLGVLFRFGDCFSLWGRRGYSGWFLYGHSVLDTRFAFGLFASFHPLIVTITRSSVNTSTTYALSAHLGIWSYFDNVSLHIQQNQSRQNNGWAVRYSHNRVTPCFLQKDWNALLIKTWSTPFLTVTHPSLHRRGLSQEKLRQGGT